MLKKHIKKFLATSLSFSLVLGLCMVPGKAEAAPETDISEWQSSISIDFGTHTSPCSAETSMQTIPGYSELADSLAPVVPGYGNMTYAGTSVADLYETATGATEQHIGFDRVLPAAKTASGGDYFTDWVFSPNGEAYSFIADLPAGQYHVFVYTGNKTKNHSNTTFVNFNNETIDRDPILYDHTSIGGRQFYGPTDTESVYTVEVNDNGEGYGTLILNLSDDTLGNEAYAASHNLTIGAELTAETPASVDHFDFYADTDDAIDSAAISNSVITARINGIEIVPVKNPVHMTEFTAPAQFSAEIGEMPSLRSVVGADDSTDRIIYKSLTPEVATVDLYSGMITTNEKGTATLFAYNTVLKKGVQTTLNVTEESYVSLDKSSANVVLDGDNEQELSLIASFNLALTDVVEWTSDNEDIVAVDSSTFKAGTKSTSTVKLIAKDTGTATITAKRTDKERAATCEITVTRAVSGVSLCDTDKNVYEDDAKLAVQEGESISISSIITPDNATNKDVVYTVSDDSIASVSIADGVAVITGKSAGEVTVTVKSNDNSDILDTITVVVTPAPVTATPVPDIQVEPTKAPDNNTPTVTPAPTDSASSKLSVTKAKKINLKVKRTITFKAKATGTTVEKVTVKCKSGKKLVKIKVKKSKIKVKALKKGKVKLVFTVKGADGTSVKVKKTIKIK